MCGILLIYSQSFADLNPNANLANTNHKIQGTNHAIQDTNPDAIQSANPSDSQQNFVFSPDLLLNQKSIDFFNATSAELAQKTGINLYVYMANSAPVNEYRDFYNHLNDKLKKPFVVITMLKNEQKIDIITSDESNKALSKDDKKKIVGEYMVPLLPQKNSESGALSAVVFNGYVEAVDLIAEKFGIEIHHNISKDEKGAKMVAQGILYLMLFSMIGLFVGIYFFKSKRT